MYHIFNNIKYLKQIILTYKLKLTLTYHIYIYIYIYINITQIITFKLKITKPNNTNLPSNIK